VDRQVGYLYNGEAMKKKQVRVMMPGSVKKEKKGKVRPYDEAKKRSGSGVPSMSRGVGGYY
jgi:hypothetical protein